MDIHMIKCATFEHESRVCEFKFQGFLEEHNESVDVHWIFTEWSMDEVRTRKL